MKAEDKVAYQRLSVLELAEALGNVSKVFRERAMSRIQFYEYKRRFQTHGFEGLKDSLPIHKSHPQPTPKEVMDKLLEMSLNNPTWGWARLSDMLKLQGTYVSPPPTIQNILHKHGMGSRYARLLKLEEKVLQNPVELTAEQAILIEKANLCFHERHVESSRPGELLAQDTFIVGTLKRVGKVYLQAVVDTYGSYAFGFLHTEKLPECAIAFLHNDVLPFYRKHGLSVSVFFTDNGREFCGRETHPCELYLALNDIEHRKTRVRRPQTNCFVERLPSDKCGASGPY
ncbi:transposase [Brevibacillus sp. SYP-B805]|nr:transposase [Brevibacillus sp. SYP-B805]